MEANKYLYCDGSIYDTAKYPKLYAILGTNQLPDLRGRFLQGNDTGGAVVEPALPNIKGSIQGFPVHRNYSFNGIIKINPTGACIYEMPIENNWFFDGSFLQIDASLSSNIYSDTCTTVQPPAVTVRYYIRAK